MTGRKNTIRRTAVNNYEAQYLNDDCQVDDLEESDDGFDFSIYDLDTVLGYSVDILKVGVPLLLGVFLLTIFIVLMATI
ncbi:MAG: hypothetical protein GX825_06570 [Syntrophomonadaceae bacterium]|nr:hypothetical protein [Syntrophomonadaceae bacterium]